MHSRDFYC